MKKGFTLIELVVAMGIFSIVCALVIGAYLAVARMSSLSQTMRESQQRLRVAMEMITRQTRQANGVIVSDGGNTLELDFKNDGVWSGKKFEISSEQLQYSTCTTMASGTCATWGTSTNLLSTSSTSVKLDSTAIPPSNFNKTVIPVPKLNILLNGKIGDPSWPAYYRDNFSINTSVPLDNLE